MFLILLQANLNFTAWRCQDSKKEVTKAATVLSLHPMDQPRLKRVEKLSLEWRHRIATWMAKACGHREADFGEVFINSLPVRNKTSPLQKLETFKTLTGPWRICHTHTPNKGLILPKVLTRTSLKMSATLAPMGLQNTASLWVTRRIPNLFFNFILLSKSAIPAHEGIDTLIQAMLPPTLCPFPLTSFPFPFIPFLSLLLSLPSPTFLLTFWEGGCGVVTASLFNLGDLLPLASTC